jgi:hypothetical protein
MLYFNIIFLTLYILFYVNNDIQNLFLKNIALTSQLVSKCKYSLGNLLYNIH